MALNRLTALALAGALALGAAGCGDDSPSPAPSTSSAAASPTPTATGPVAPVLPDQAKGRTDNGARAFVEFWFRAVTHAMRSGDVDLIERIAAPECKGCNNLIQMIADIYDDELVIKGGGWKVRGVALDERVSMPYRRFAVTMVQPEMTVVNKSGHVVKRDKSQRGVLLVTTLWREGRWYLFESVLAR